MSHSENNIQDHICSVTGNDSLTTMSVTYAIS